MYGKKGNRDLVYSIENVVVTKESGESSLEACERYMKSYEGGEDRSYGLYAGSGIVCDQ